MTKHKVVRNCILLMALFAVLAPALLVQAITRTVDTIPIEYAPPLIDHPLIKLRFGKSRPLTLMLDTGSSIPFILHRSALMEIMQANRLTQARVLKGDHHATQWEIPCPVTADVGLREKPVLLCRHFKCWVPTAAAESHEDIPQVVGVVGISLFSQGAHAQDLFQLDLAHHVVRLSKSPTDPFDSQAVSVAMRHFPPAPGDYQIKWTAANAHSHETCWMIVDSGSPITIVPNRMRNYLQLREGFSKTFGISTIATKVIEAPITVAPEFTIVGQEKHTVTEKNLVVQWTDATEPVLGLNFLSRYRITFDPKHGKLWLRKLQDVPREYYMTLGDVGIDVSRQRGTLRVTAIDKRLLMADQPLHVGDEILAIDGHEASHLSEWQAEALLDGYADTVGFLRVRSVDQRTANKISLLRKSPFSVGQPDVVATWVIKQVTLRSKTQALVEFTNGMKLSLPYLGR